MKMRSFKLVIGLLLIALLLPAVKTQAQDKVVTVTWWATERGRDTAATRQLHFDMARAFEAANPNIKVALSLYPNKGFGTRVLTAISAGEGPDVWYAFHSPDIAEQGFLEDLTPDIKKDGVDKDWFPIGTLRSQYNGKLYGAPRDAAAGFIVYNKDM